MRKGRVRRTMRKDEIRRKGEYGRSESKKWAGRSKFPCIIARPISPICSSEHVGQQCPLRGERPRRTSLHPLFHTRFHAAAVVPGVFPVAALSTASKGAPPATVERRWRVLVKIRNAASSVDSCNMVPCTCALGDEVGTQVPFNGSSTAKNPHAVDSASQILQQCNLRTAGSYFKIFYLS